jgi:hypothetical protein
MSNKSRYQTMLNKLRSTLIDDADEFKFFVHTSLGTIDVETVWHRYEGFVAIEGEDENHKYRFLMFSEEVICCFPLEVKRKNDSKNRLGFKSILQPAPEDAS